MKTPPYNINETIAELILNIGILLGKYEGINKPIPEPKLRRKNLVKTIQSSLAIEGNTLELDQVTAILDGKRVIAPKRDLHEIKNAIEVYKMIGGFSSSSSRDFLKAHRVLMNGLVEVSGKWRSKGVGIIKGKNVKHIAPPQHFVPGLMKDLFLFIKKNKNLSPLIKSCIFHYESQFIHPFIDGNGRMGRLWQSVILSNWNPVFSYVPIEHLISKNQNKYYEVLEICDNEGESTKFIEFMLNIIKIELGTFLDEIKVPTQTNENRINQAIQIFGKEEFSRKMYMNLFKNISAPTASRDLAYGIEKSLIIKFGSKNQSKYKSR